MLSQTLSQGLLCVLKVFFSEERYTLLKGMCILVHVYIYIYNYYYYSYCQISHVGHNWHAELKRIARALVFTKGANASRQGIGSGPVTSKKTSEDLWMDVVSRKATFLNKLDMTTRWVNSVSSSNLSCWPQLTCWTETYCKSSCFHQGGQCVSTPLQSHCFKPRKCTVQVTVDG